MIVSVLPDVLFPNFKEGELLLVEASNGFTITRLVPEMTVPFRRGLGREQVAIDGFTVIASVEWGPGGRYRLAIIDAQAGTETALLAPDSDSDSDLDEGFGLSVDVGSGVVTVAHAFYEYTDVANFSTRYNVVV
ncbi:MAG: hypothetical protein AB8C13_09475 [Phycisphaerales bacterium]